MPNQKLIVIIAFILIATASTYYFWDDLVGLFSKNELIEEQQVTTLPQEKTELTPQSQSQPQPADCGADFNCFISTTQNCGLAKVNHMIEGFINITSFLEVQGIQKETNTCVFYLRIDKVDLPSFANEETKKTANEMIGNEGTCLFKNGEDLTNLLKKWGMNDYSGSAERGKGDLKNADCSGDYFGTEW